MDGYQSVESIWNEHLWKYRGPQAQTREQIQRSGHETPARSCYQRRQTNVILTKLNHPITHGRCHSFIIKLIVNSTLDHLSGEDIHHSPNNRTGDPPEKSTQVNW